MSLHRLTFDTSDATSIAQSANVGAYLRDSGGDLLTSTLVGADQALDVNLVQSVTLTVQATDLDIRDLSASQDNVAISDGTDTLAVNADGSINITDNSGSITVDATQLDIDDLNATDDAVAAWTHDGSGNAITSTTGHLDVNIASSDIEIDVEDDLADTALASSAESVSTSGTLFTSDLANRRFIWLYNNGNKAVYIGPSGVATSDGFPIFPGSILEARIGPNVAVHAVAESGTQEVRALQAS